MKLGKLIRELTKCSKESNDPESLNVVLLFPDKTSAAPQNLMSYRGFYEDLAISYDTFIGINKAIPRTRDLTSLINELKDAVGEVFIGYKGGHFKMDLDTNVWVSQHGDAESLVPFKISLKSRDNLVVISLKKEAC